MALTLRLFVTKKEEQTLTSTSTAMTGFLKWETVASHSVTTLQRRVGLDILALEDTER